MELTADLKRLCPNPRCDWLTPAGTCLLGNDLPGCEEYCLRDMRTRMLEPPVRKRILFSGVGVIPV